MGMTMEELLETGRTLWGDGVDPTPENVHAAAAGLASNWYRNTDAVEVLVHCAGLWSDLDMLRNNARATLLAKAAITDVVDDSVSEEPTQAEDRLHSLLEDFIDLLPTGQARDELWIAKQNAPSFAATWIESNGLGNWLAFLTANSPRAWWGTAGYSEIVDQYCALDPSPPDSQTFRDRMLNAPWDLSYEQAEFVCGNRYDVERDAGTPM